MLWCVIYGPKRLLLLSELFYMLWCVIYGPPCISSGQQKTDNPIELRITQKLRFAYKLNLVHHEQLVWVKWSNFQPKIFKNTRITIKYKIQVKICNPTCSCWKTAFCWIADNFSRHLNFSAEWGLAYKPCYPGIPRTEHYNVHKKKDQ